VSRLLRVIRIYLRTKFTWRAAWRATSGKGDFQIVVREDGELYIQPRVAPPSHPDPQPYHDIH
jgi:hypothetical protein